MSGTVLRKDVSTCSTSKSNYLIEFKGNGDVNDQTKENWPISLSRNSYRKKEWVFYDQNVVTKQFKNKMKNVRSSSISTSTSTSTSFSSAMNKNDSDEINNYNNNNNDDNNNDDNNDNDNNNNNNNNNNSNNNNNNNNDYNYNDNEATPYNTRKTETKNHIFVSWNSCAVTKKSVLIT